ncbi:MAG: hypothetical protein J2P48_16470 [Alphaproteobacteria bacterium]|nr:hypothetical protein [Alphaproteobacteria bacterium]
MAPHPRLLIGPEPAPGGRTADPARFTPPALSFWRHRRTVETEVARQLIAESARLPRRASANRDAVAATEELAGAIGHGTMAITAVAVMSIPTADPRPDSRRVIGRVVHRMPGCGRVGEAFRSALGRQRLPGLAVAAHTRDGCPPAPIEPLVDRFAGIAAGLAILVVITLAVRPPHVASAAARGD